MEQKTFRSYFKSLWLLLLLLFLQPVSDNLRAQEQYGNTRPQGKVAKAKKDQKKVLKENEMLYPKKGGFTVSTDFLSLAGGVLGGTYKGGELSLDYNLYNRYFPVFEIGYGKSDKWNDDENIHQKSSAPFVRIGVDYNMLYKKKHGNQLRIGLRYGVSNVKYDIAATGVNAEGESTGAKITDDYWNEDLLYDHSGMKCTMHWLELGIEVKARINKHIFMGWRGRMRYRLSASPDTYGDPWYIPGYGRYKSKGFGLGYSIGYHF